MEKVFKLRKLPLWGRQASADEINFQWPTEDLLSSLPEDVKLESLHFKRNSDYGPLGYVKVTLSNGMASPEFCKPNSSREIEMAPCRFDPRRPVRSVQGDDSKGSVPFVKSLTFLDERDYEVGAYNPKRLPRSGTTHVLKENEELIGVYGVSHEKQSFSAFGFIVKVTLLQRKSASY